MRGRSSASELSRRTSTAARGRRTYGCGHYVNYSRDRASRPCSSRARRPPVVTTSAAARGSFSARGRTVTAARARLSNGQGSSMQSRRRHQHDLRACRLDRPDAAMASRSCDSVATASAGAARGDLRVARSDPPPTCRRRRRRRCAIVTAFASRTGVATESVRDRFAERQRHDRRRERDRSRSRSRRRAFTDARATPPASVILACSNYDSPLIVEGSVASVDAVAGPATNRTGGAAVRRRARSAISISCLLADYRRRYRRSRVRSARLDFEGDLREADRAGMPVRSTSERTSAICGSPPPA